MAKEKISIKGISYAHVLQALYNNAKSPNNTFYKMSLKKAQEIINLAFENDNFFLQEVYMRELYIDISTNEFDPTEYDKRNGEEGLAKKIIYSLRELLGGKTFRGSVNIDYEKNTSSRKL
ncbi:MAG: hypothetical protein J0H68_02605 [Sphingobacteriia bacterium]|nr:hypothetical protein [Sphingobacteriia bacterium]